MNQPLDASLGIPHGHVFLGRGHHQNERKTWAVIALCSVMMLVEIVGGIIFGSLALVADGLHMSTHASAMLIAALAYMYARKHANDQRFVFGTGKLGDLAGFASAIILAMIAILIGYEAVARFLAPVAIRFAEAIPIAVVGLVVNVASAWLLSGADHGHGHGHSHGGDAQHSHVDEERVIETAIGPLRLLIFEDGVPPVFRIRTDPSALAAGDSITLATTRANGTQQVFSFTQQPGYLESTQPVPEPHEFKLVIKLPQGEYSSEFSKAMMMSIRATT